MAARGWDPFGMDAGWRIWNCWAWMGNGGSARYGWGTGDRTAARRRSAHGAGGRGGGALAAPLTTWLKPGGGAHVHRPLGWARRAEGPLAQTGRKHETASREQNELKRKHFEMSIAAQCGSKRRCVKCDLRLAGSAEMWSPGWELTLGSTAGFDS